MARRRSRLYNHEEDTGEIDQVAREVHEEEFEEEEEERHGRNGGVRTLNLVRGYVLLFSGVGLIIWSFLGSGALKPGALTLGGALIGFNPLFRATMGAESGGHR